VDNDSEPQKGFGMCRFSKRDLYCNVLQELYSKESQWSQMDQLSILCKNVKREQSNGDGTTYYGQEREEYKYLLCTLRRPPSSTIKRDESVKGKKGKGKMRKEKCDS
jgi:hypothetical protein